MQLKERSKNRAPATAIRVVGRVSLTVVVVLGLVAALRIGGIGGASTQLFDHGDGYVIDSDDLPRTASGEPDWEILPFVAAPVEVPVEVQAAMEALDEQQAQIEASYVPDLAEFAFPDLPPDPQ